MPRDGAQLRCRCAGHSARSARTEQLGFRRHALTEGLERNRATLGRPTEHAGAGLRGKCDPCVINVQHVPGTHLTRGRAWSSRRPAPRVALAEGRSGVPVELAFCLSDGVLNFPFRLVELPFTLEARVAGQAASGVLHLPFDVATLSLHRVLRAVLRKIFILRHRFLRELLPRHVERRPSVAAAYSSWQGRCRRDYVDRPPRRALGPRSCLAS